MASPSTSGRGEQKRDSRAPLESSEERISVSALTPKQYEVFINHRGVDVKATLAKQLYDSLEDKGIRAYLDVKETELGDYIPSAIKNAISSARVHIAIFSPRYAESAWCLAELALMYQTKARIIPLFYNVQPSDFRHIENGQPSELRHIKNEVVKAFSKHKSRYTNDVIQKWKECLHIVSEINGYELSEKNDYQSKMHDVVSAVVNEKQKRKIPFQVAKYEVGLDELLNDFRSHCQRNGEMKDRIIGIYGMGGSGKTTLVQYFFSRKHSEFSGSTILFDVRDKQAKGKMISLQFQLLKDLSFKKNDIKENDIPDEKVGIAFIKNKLERSPESRFLIVIDDVEHKRQFDALVPIVPLNSDSLVIVTTRDESLLKQVGIRVRYKIKEMDREHSRLLFCWHAFQKKCCRTGFENLVDSFVKECGGLPLALEVMGGLVFGRDKAYWRLQLGEVRAKLPGDIRETLKVSYDALEKDQKKIFMDIACFFLGNYVSTSMAVSIWKASGWRAEYALQTLMDKCLVEITLGPGSVSSPDVIGNYELKYYFKMHDHLRDLGREMANIETPRRLRRLEDLNKTHDIKGFQDILMSSQGESFRCYSSLYDYESNLRMRFLLECAGTSTELRWVDLEYKIPEWIPLQNLHTLNLEGDSPWRLWRTNKQVSLELKELRCFFRPRLTHSNSDSDSSHGYNCQFSLKLKELCCFLWPCLTDSSKDEDKSLRDLNELVSSFGMFKNLETLHLNFEPPIYTWNTEWKCLLKSVRLLTNLKTLELMYFQIDGEFAFSNSGEAADDRLCMGSLEAITLCGAYKTRKVTISGESCPNLKSLKLYTMSDLMEVDIRGVTTLECLVLLKCRELRRVLVDDLPYLEKFEIRICRSITELPNIGSVSCLKTIFINRCYILKDISATERLKGLERVWIAYCRELKDLKAIENLKRLKRIWIYKCTDLEGAICFKELKALKGVFIGNCPRLQSIQGMEFLKSLENFVITGCPQLQRIPGIEELRGLKEVIITDTLITSCIESLQRLPEELTIMVGRAAMADKIAEELERCTERLMTLPEELKSQREDIIAEEVRFKWTPVVSDVIADKIGDRLSPLGDVLEIDGYAPGWQYASGVDVKEHIKRMIRDFRKTQHSVGRFIFCTTVDMAAGMPEDSCNWSKTLHAVGLGYPAGWPSKMIYICVVSEERFSNFDYWFPSEAYMDKGFLVGVKRGEESETLPILQSLVAQVGAGSSECYEDPREMPIVRDDDDDFFETWIDRDDFIEQYDGGEEQESDLSD